MAAPDTTTTALVDQMEAHRRALTGYCYRMLGSGSEAEDAVQETMVRAWKAADRLQEHAALRSWLHRIATNVCFDMMQTPQRRALPMDLGPSSAADGALGAALGEQAWVQPIAEARVVELHADPADVAEVRETLRLAFVAALQHLPPRQRAVLVLCEVLRWQASEAAALLDTSVASVNSALQRARATLAALDLEPGGQPVVPEEQEALLERYVDTFERYDIDALVALLREDATFSMPPYPLWLEGPDAAAAFMRGTGAKCEGSRLLPTRASGSPAAGIYNQDPDGGYAPWALVVLDVRDEAIVGLHHFIGTDLTAFGLPARL